jgi:hypothetical protein
MMADTKVTPAEQIALDMLEKRKSMLLHREALPTGERVTLTPEQAQARKRRGQWMAIALFAFCILVFLITMTKVGASMLMGGA